MSSFLRTFPICCAASITRLFESYNPFNPVVTGSAEVAFSSQTSLDPAHQSIRSLYFELADLLLQRAALMTEDSEADSYLKAARDAIEAA